MHKMIKLGGSLITDKLVEQSFRADVMSRIAHEIAAALPSLTQPLIIGHGSGSFGHFAAKRHDTIHGVQSAEQWRGFAEVAFVASQLNNLVAQQLWREGVPVMRFQSSVALTSNDGVPQDMPLDNIRQALKNGLVPLVYGDVGFDTTRGGTIISTESLFTYLAESLEVSEIFLVGEVAGVLDDNGVVIPLITPETFGQAQGVIKGSRGTDVTGGMLTKVTDMVALVQSRPGMTIHILDGLTEGVLQNALMDKPTLKTTIRAS